MSTIDTRREQMFPKLEPREIDRLRRFGDVRRYSAGEALFVTGEIAPGMAVLIKGSVRVTRRDPLGHRAPIVEQGAGEFVAEVGQLSGQPAFVDVHAIDDVEALLIRSENLRALVIEEPQLGERIMRALILRRVALVEAGAGGPVLIGPESTPDVIRLQGFLARNAYPHQLLDPTQDRDAAELVKQYAPNPADLPLAVCPKGSILKNPSETELARELGMVPIDERERTYDVAVVGAGPAGLSSTAASGIRTLAEVDRPGVRVVGIANTTTIRAAGRSLINIVPIAVTSIDDAVAMLRAGQADAFALGRDSLPPFVAEFPGSHIVDGGFQQTGIAIAVPKGHPEALAYVTKFIEDAKASGSVRRAMDRAGMANLAVAPPEP